MKRAVVLSIALILIVSIGLIAVIGYTSLSKNSKQQFHVGVTYGGDDSADAKLLIDKVKNYTNLFVVMSSALRNNITELEKTCDYAVAAGLDVIVTFSYSAPQYTAFINDAQERWGSHFLGVYYSDEPGGRMLDLGMVLHDDNGTSITKQTGYYSFQADQLDITVNPDSGMMSVNAGDDVSMPQYLATYYSNGTISYYFVRGGSGMLYYQPDGTVEDQNGNPVTDAKIPHFEPYQKLWDLRPVKNYTDAARFYITTQQDTLDSFSNQSSVKLFTSDYALHWWDYQGGYNTVFAELGWNNTAAQEIGLVRGAANLQGKDWGTIITWTYTQPPYLTSGDEMYNQMRLSYECGAKYVVVFNYAENMTDSYGTIQDEHFQALQRFWNEVVQDGSVVHGGIKAEAVLVLPNGYGWGMRNPNDTIWGLWKADGTSQQVWNQVQNKLAEYDSKLDIVYDDAAYPVVGKYGQVFYWNQTS